MCLTYFYPKLIFRMTSPFSELVLQWRLAAKERCGFDGEVRASKNMIWILFVWEFIVGRLVRGGASQHERRRRSSPIGSADGCQFGRGRGGRRRGGGGRDRRSEEIFRESSIRSMMNVLSCNRTAVFVSKNSYKVKDWRRLPPPPHPRLPY